MKAIGFIIVVALVAACVSCVTDNCIDKVVDFVKGIRKGK